MEGEVTPGITKEEYKNRRKNLMELIAKSSQEIADRSHIVIIPSAPKMYMTHDIPYPFRQNTDFLYLCGFLEPDSFLILEGNSSTLPDHKATLFVPKKDELKELWEGHRSGTDGAIKLTGIENAFNTDDLQMYLNKIQESKKSLSIWYEYKKPVHLSFHLKLISDFMKNNSFGILESPKKLLHKLRVIKSPAEQELMQTSNKIASDAIKKTIKFSHPGINEAHIYAKVDYECRLGGAEMLGYPPVVAGGNRANTIHYVSNNQIVEDQELVLMDAGCEYHGYNSDITRTWPVSGNFTDAQRCLYEATLEVQELCVGLCGIKEMTLDMVYKEMLYNLGRQLQRLGILKQHLDGSTLHYEARQYCPHHVGHYLGMDVHDTDTLSRSLLFTPGMCITIEPGLYMPYGCAAPSDFHGIGIRIEDDILITDDGYINMTANCPKHPNELKKLFKDEKNK